MKKITLLLLGISLFFQLSAQKENLLSGKYNEEELQKILIPKDQWTPFPKLNDRAGWSKADQEMMQSYLKDAEQYINYNWPSLPATTSLLIVRNGNRSEYDGLRFKKRQVLATLLLAEIYENKGRFIDPIINGVYSICEETFWGVPAHLPKSKDYRD